MILNYDHQTPLHLIGSGIVVQELKRWLEQDNCDVKIIDKDRVSDLAPGSNCMLGFWNMDHRINFINNVDYNKYCWPTYIHPSACVVADHNSIGKGTIVHPMSFVGYPTVIGNFSLIGVFTSLGHGAKLGLNNIVSPGTVIGGSTEVGNNVCFGQKSSVKDKIVIGSNIRFFMNSVVSKNVVEAGTYFGSKKVPYK